MSAEHAQWNQQFTHAPEVLKAVDELVRDREAADLEMTPAERSTLSTVRRDAIHNILQEKDKECFDEMSWLKQVELKYLHQVRGIRQVIPGAIFGDGYMGYGNGWTGNKMRLLYAQDRKRAGRTSRELIMPIQMELSTAFLSEELVTVRLDFENDKYRLRDAFTWNVKDNTVPLEIFIENLLEDFCLPLNLTHQIMRSAKEQLDSYIPQPYIDTSKLEPLPDGQPRDEDMRIVIKLEINIDQHTYSDKFEWDMNCEENSPEEMGELTAREQALPPEFATAIAQGIREQCQAHTKMFQVVRYPFDGRPVQDPELQAELCPTVSNTSFLRAPSLLPSYTPVLHQMAPTEVERQDYDRESRRRRRMGRSSRRSGYAQIQPPATVSELKESSRSLETPIYSAVLPGGLDKNLDILRMYACNSEDHENEREGLYYYNKLRQTRGIPSASLFSLDMPLEHQHRYMVKLKIPRARK